MNYNEYNHNLNNDIVATDVEHIEQFRHENTSGLYPMLYTDSPPRNPQPVLARLYNSLLSEYGLTYVSDITAKGTFTSIAGTTVNTAITLSASPNFGLLKFPMAVSLCLAVKSFHIAPQAPITTLGALECVYVSNGGKDIGLGEYQNNVASNILIKSICTSPITDTDNPQLGTLAVTLQNGSASPGTYNYMLNFNIIYLLPSSGPVDDKGCIICKHKEHINHAGY